MNETPGYPGVLCVRNGLPGAHKELLLEQNLTREKKIIPGAMIHEKTRTP
jgi:hypothetical protein